MMDSWAAEQLLLSLSEEPLRGQEQNGLVGMVTQLGFLTPVIPNAGN